MGLNATTSHDATKYFMSLPANMLELWFALEAERFQVRLVMLALPCMKHVTQLCHVMVYLYLGFLHTCIRKSVKA